MANFCWMHWVRWILHEDKQICARSFRPDKFYFIKPGQTHMLLSREQSRNDNQIYSPGELRRGLSVFDKQFRLSGTGCETVDNQLRRSCLAVDRFFSMNGFWQWVYWTPGEKPIKHKNGSFYRLEWHKSYLHMKWAQFFAIFASSWAITPLFIRLVLIISIVEVRIYWGTVINSAYLEETLPILTSSRQVYRSRPARRRSSSIRMLLILPY